MIVTEYKKVSTTNLPKHEYATKAFAKESTVSTMYPFSYLGGLGGQV